MLPVVAVIPVTAGICVILGVYPVICGAVTAEKVVPSLVVHELWLLFRVNVFVTTVSGNNVTPVLLI